MDKNTLTAGNQSGSTNEDSGKSPVLHPDSGEDGSIMEVVWSSPVSTGSGAGKSRQLGTIEASIPEDGYSWHNRQFYAFESDLLDNAFVHWERDAPTLEMIAGFKKDAPPENADDLTYPVESVFSGQSSLISEATDGPITRVDPDAPHPGTDSAAAKPFQPDQSGGSPGPMRIREDGVEDPIRGWRPTGMVFFETLSTPPRGTVYSSSLLDAFKQSLKEQGRLKAEPASMSSTPERDSTAPFFDFPEAVAPAPPEDTEDFPLEPIVVKRRGGGGGGSRLFRFAGRMFLLMLALVGIVGITIAGSYMWYMKHRLYDTSETGRPVTVTIHPGENFRSVINQMKKDGLLHAFMGLDDRYLMRYLAYVYENSDKVKPGVYRFNSGDNLQDVYDKLITGSKDFKITIPEGKTAREVADIVGGQYTTFDPEYFMQLVNDPAFIKSLGVDAPSLEGYLYPSTYYFGPGMKEEDLIKLMVSTFQKKVEGIADKMTSTGLTFQQHVIMASLIEREARLDEDRPLIASVIYNRLEKDIPLQIDATVNYALNDWRRLNNSDYETSHPYNTYKFKGLPPGPIASPRIESLEATYQAPDTDFLYYVYMGNGHHAFATSYAQHQANVGRYIREKNSPGMGNEPNSDIQAVEDTMKSDEKAPAVAGDSSSSNKSTEPDQAGKSDGQKKSDVSQTTPKSADSEPKKVAPKSY